MSATVEVVSIGCSECHQHSPIQHEAATPASGAFHPRRALASWQHGQQSVSILDNRARHRPLKFFNEARGFGFIKEEGGHSLFVHGSQVHGGTLAVGDRVEFLIGTDRKTGKRQAHSVRVVQAA